MGSRWTSRDSSGRSRRNGNVPGPQLVVDPAPGDTALANFVLSPISRSPESDPQLASDFTDYTAVLTSIATSGPDALALGGMPARRVFLRFDIPPAVSRARLDRSRGEARTLDKFEQEAADFFERVRAAYLELAHEAPSRFHVIDASRPLAEVRARLGDVLAAL